MSMTKGFVEKVEKVEYAIAIAICGVLLAGACTSDNEDVVQAPFAVAGAGVESAYLYQVTEVPLLISGQIVTRREVPIIVGREARIRVIIRTIASAQARSVAARLSIGSDGPSIIEEQIELVPGASSEVVFTVPSDLVTAEAAISISLWELDDVRRNGDTSVSRWPKDHEFPLAPRDPGVFRLMLVPVQPNSIMGVPIEFTPELLAEIESDMLAQMPVRAVELTAREPVSWGDNLSDFSSWSQLLLLIANLREQDGADDDVHYFGMIPLNPQLALGGLAATLSNSPFWRVSIGVRGTRSNVMLHEITHVLGRAHTPCGDPGGPDPFYPHAGAVLGNTGFDFVTGEWIDGATTFDVMSYCSPVWTSDYTYTAVFKSILAVNATAMARTTPAPRRLVHAYALHDKAIVAAGEHHVVMPPLTTVHVDGVERRVGVVKFHDADGSLFLTSQRLAPGAVVRTSDLKTFTLVGGVR